MITSGLRQLMNSLRSYIWLKMNRVLFASPAAAPVPPHRTQIVQQGVSEGVNPDPCEIKSQSMLMQTTTRRSGRDF